MLGVGVGIAAAIGAVCRYLFDQWVQRRHNHPFPWGTFAVNVSGSLLLGLITGLAEQHGLPARLTTVIGVGLIGGYTTWSTYLWETVALAESESIVIAAANLVGSLAAGLAAAAAGLGLAQV